MCNLVVQALHFLILLVFLSYVQFHFFCCNFVVIEWLCVNEIDSNMVYYGIKMNLVVLWMVWFNGLCFGSNHLKSNKNKNKETCGKKQLETVRNQA